MAQQFKLLAVHLSAPRCCAVTPQCGHCTDSLQPFPLLFSSQGNLSYLATSTPFLSYLASKPALSPSSKNIWPGAAQFSFLPLTAESEASPVQPLPVLIPAVSSCYFCSSKHKALQSKWSHLNLALRLGSKGKLLLIVPSPRVKQPRDGARSRLVCYHWKLTLYHGWARLWAMGRANCQLHQWVSKSHGTLCRHKSDTWWKNGAFGTKPSLLYLSPYDQPSTCALLLPSADQRDTANCSSWNHHRTAH